MADELINRNKAIEALVYCTIFLDKESIARKCRESNSARRGWLGGIYDAIEAVEDAPAVDAVEVVRCIDCKHCEFDQTEEFLPDGGSNYYQHFGCKRIRELTGEWCEVYVDGFCDRGDRKDGKGDADGWVHF